MNYSTLSLLSQDDSVIAIKATFTDEPGLNNQNYSYKKPKAYTYKTTLKNLKPDDLIVVQSAGESSTYGFAVVKVVEVNAEVDFNSEIGLKWVVSKLELDEFDELIEAEKQLIASVKSAEKLNKKQQLIAALGLANVNKLSLSDFRSQGFVGGFDNASK